MTSLTIRNPDLLQRLLPSKSLSGTIKVRRPVSLLQNSMQVGMYKKRGVDELPEGYLSGNVSSESEEESLCSELESPDADFLDTSFTHCSVVEDIASKCIVHLIYC